MQSNYGVFFRNCMQCKSASVEVHTENQIIKQVKHKKVALVQLGCPKNVVDGEVLLGDLKQHGYEVTDDAEEADAVIINTCAFIDQAKKESVASIMEAAELQIPLVEYNDDDEPHNESEDLQAPTDIMQNTTTNESDIVQTSLTDAAESRKQGDLRESIDAVASSQARNNPPKIIVTGCLAQRYSEFVEHQMPHADLWLGFEKYAELPQRLDDMFDPAKDGASDGEVPITRSPFADEAGGANQQAAPMFRPPSGKVHVGAPTVPFRSEATRVRLGPTHSAYLRVAEGCNHECTFCAIPGFRGKFRSKPWRQLLAEAEALVDSGVVELNLIAEDTNQYGQDRFDGKGLDYLLRELAKLEKLKWIRILYAYPSYFTDALIAEIANNPKVCKYIDIPLQHISNLMLLAMRRPPRQYTLDLLTKLRQNIPDLALRTTFISGFPGETREQHEELVRFCADFRFERMGAFAYSVEDGTPAAAMEGQLKGKLKRRRRDELMQLSSEVQERFAEGLVGREIEVLVEGEGEDGEWYGRTQWDAPDIDNVVLLVEEEGKRKLEEGQMRRCVVERAVCRDLEVGLLD